MAQKSKLTLALCTFMKHVGQTDRAIAGQFSRRLRSGSGYDYFGNLKEAIRKFLLDGISHEDAVAIAEKNGRLSQRLHSRQGFEAFAKLFAASSHKWIAPSGGELNFSSDLAIKISPEMAFQEGGKTVQIAIWNTNSPELKKRAVDAGLSIMRSTLTEEKFGFQVWDLKKSTIHDISQVAPNADAIAQLELKRMHDLWVTARTSVRSQDQPLADGSELPALPR